MPIDASIFGQIQPQQPVNQLANLAQALQIQGLQRQGEQADRTLDQQNKLADLYRGAVGPDGTIDRTKLLSGAASGGLGAQIPTIQKGLLEQDKAQREAEKAQIEGHLKKFELAGQIMNGVGDQASWDRARAQTAQVFGPDAAAKMPAQYDPALIQENLAKAMTVKDALEQKYKALTFGETQRHNQATEGNAAGTLAVGQGNLAVNQQRLATEQNAPKGQVVQSDEGPILVDPRTGTGKPITGPNGQQLAGVTKPLNDSQSKSLLFGSRMREADKILGTLQGEGTTTSFPGSRTPVVGGVINYFAPENQQMLNQAKLDFMTATLRRESGAAISTGEYDSADKQYFPQPGDSEKVIAQKARNRQIAIQGVLSEVPEEQRGSISSAAAAEKPAGVLKVTNAADYAKVPSGATYTSPDGSIRRKP
jgi:hypothetical protein